MKVNISKLKWVMAYVVFSYLPNANAGMSGEELYFQNCMACHAYDGSGSMPGVVDFKDASSWKEMDEQTLLLKLKQGIQKEGAAVSMPPNGGNPNLTDKELKKIIRYIRKTFK